MRRELLQPPCRSGSREDLPDALIGDRDDPLVGLLAVSEELQRVPGPLADPDRAPAVLPIERHVAAAARGRRQAAGAAAERVRRPRAPVP